MKKHLLNYLFLLITVVGFAQSKLITGSVLIDEGADITSTSAGIRIENLRSDARTYTNYSGLYSIQANVGDTILFEADFLVPRKIVVNQNIFSKESEKACRVRGHLV